jgi:hypothetical protein
MVARSDTQKAFQWATIEVVARESSSLAAIRAAEEREAAEGGEGKATKARKRTWKLQVVVTKGDLLERKELCRRLQELSATLEDRLKGFYDPNLPIVSLSGLEKKGCSSSSPRRRENGKSNLYLSNTCNLSNQEGFYLLLDLKLFVAKLVASKMNFCP